MDDHPYIFIIRLLYLHTPQVQKRIRRSMSKRIKKKPPGMNRASKPTNMKSGITEPNITFTPLFRLCYLFLLI
jgi:hypothetical protein